MKHGFALHMCKSFGYCPSTTEKNEPLLNWPQHYNMSIREPKPRVRIVLGFLGLLCMNVIYCQFRSHLETLFLFCLLFSQGWVGGVNHPCGTVYCSPLSATTAWVLFIEELCFFFLGCDSICRILKRYFFCDLKLVGTNIYDLGYC